MTIILTLLLLATSGLAMSSYLGFWPDRVYLDKRCFVI